MYRKDVSPMAKINRKAVVEQYSPVNTAWDAYSPFSVGNGNKCDRMWRFRFFQYGKYRK